MRNGRATLIPARISSRTISGELLAGPSVATHVRNALTQSYGAHATSVDSIGPTFGASVTHAAIIAIIGYIGYRFMTRGERGSRIEALTTIAGSEG